VENGFFCGLRQQGQTAWSASALRVLSAVADPAEVLWGLGGGCVGVLRCWEVCGCGCVLLSPHRKPYFGSSW